MEGDDFNRQSYRPKAVIRKPAPPFSLMSWDKNCFRRITLEQFRGRYVVLFFYPADFTFVCPTEICEFNDAAEEFKATECELLAASGDSQFVHREYTLKSREDGGLGAMQIPMLADVDRTLGKDYGVYLDHSDDAGLTLRGTFIIDREGVLRHISINDLPVGRNVRETLRLVKAFQYSDVYGEVCPAQWEPGQGGMVPDHESDKLQDFWKNQHAKAN